MSNAAKHSYPPRLSACLARNPALVASTTRHFGDFILESGLTDAEAFQLRLVLSEALNNLVEHAPPVHEAGSGIGIECWIGEDQLHLEVRDSGPAMRALPGGELPDGLSERGRGWPIIHHWADEISYRSHQGQNILSLKKFLGSRRN